MTETYKYFAFISYSSKDAVWAKWLMKVLEGYRVPRRLVGTLGRDGEVPQRMRPMFRDRDELPTSSDLGSAIGDALEQSRYLIVICSPNSAQSHWVREEIKAFKKMGRANRILCLIVDGEPNVSEGAGIGETESFAPELRFDVREDGSLSDIPAEPIAADVRPGMDGKENAKLKLIAGILGVDFDSLRQRQKRRQRQRMLQFAAAAMVVLIGSAFGYMQYREIQDRGFIEQSLALAADAREAVDAEDYTRAISLALAALPADIKNPDRPIMNEAINALQLALHSTDQVAVLAGHLGELDREKSSRLAGFVTSLDASRFLSYARDGKIILWNGTEFTKIAEWQKSEFTSNAWFADGDEKVVIRSKLDDDRISLTTMSAETGEPLTSFEFSHNMPPEHFWPQLDPYPVGDGLTTGSFEWNDVSETMLITVRNVETGAVLDKINIGQDYTINDAIPLDDHRIILFRPNDAAIYDLSTGQVTAQLSGSDQLDYFNNLTVDDAGDYAAAYRDKILYLWRLSDGALLSRRERSYVDDMVFTKRGGFLRMEGGWLSAEGEFLNREGEELSEQTVLDLGLLSGRELWLIEQDDSFNISIKQRYGNWQSRSSGFEAGVGRAARSPTGNLFFVIELGGRVTIFDRPTSENTSDDALIPEPVHSFTLSDFGEDSALVDLSWSPNERFLIERHTPPLSMEENDTRPHLLLHDLAAGGTVYDSAELNLEYISNLRFVANDSEVYFQSSRGLHRWDLDLPTMSATLVLDDAVLFPDEQDHIHDFAISDQENLLAIVTYRGAVDLWQLGGDSLIDTVPAHLRDGNSDDYTWYKPYKIHFDTEGGRLFFVNDSDPIEYWTLSEPEVLYQFEEQSEGDDLFVWMATNEVTSIGQYGDSTLTYDIESGKLLYALDDVEIIVPHGERDIFLTMPGIYSANQTVRQHRSGDALAELSCSLSNNGYGGPFDTLRFALDGKYILATAFDVFCVWDAETFRLVAQHQVMGSNGIEYVEIDDEEHRAVTIDDSGRITSWALFTDPVDLIDRARKFQDLVTAP